jgi:hypothetical protein
LSDKKYRKKPETKRIAHECAVGFDEHIGVIEKIHGD